METTHPFGTEKISKILLKMAPPVMLAQLIQALYNIVDSLFVGRYAQTGLTALSIIYPMQLLMIALAVGMGVGINTAIAARLGLGQKEEAENYARTGTPIALCLWVIFALACWFIMPFYARMSTPSEEVIREVVVYGRIVCLFSIGLFLESIWTKILQANGDMKTPMFAQIIGAITNIILDPLLIFGMFGLPKLGIAGAAIATVVGQMAAAVVVAGKGFRGFPKWDRVLPYLPKIFRLGLPNILMQSAYTFYILGLNLILSTFSDQAVTALGLYYKWQTFFFIPMGAMQTCMVPIVSYNYAAKNIDRCRRTLSVSVMGGFALMAIGVFCFECIPVQLMHVFTPDERVVEIGRIGFRWIGSSFIPMVTALTFPVFFQATGYGLKSSLLTIIRTVVLFVPLGYVFAKFGLEWFWLTFPVTEVVTTAVGIVFYRQFLAHPYTKHVKKERAVPEKELVIKPSHPGVIVTIAREHGSSGKQIGKLVAERMGIPFYYKEMTALAAQESGLDREFISDLNQNAPKILHELYLSTTVVQYAVLAQHKIIQKIAENGSCVIVGRAADYVLKDHADVLRVFLYAPEEYKIHRIMELYGDSEDEAREHMRHSDEARAAYYRRISGHEWGERHQYDLLVDASCGMEQAAKIICDAIALRKK